MSDALIDINRDEERKEILNKIADTEKEFSSGPSKEKAEALINLWKKYMGIKSGYWGSSNKSIAYEQIGLLRRYIKTGDVKGIGAFPGDKNNDTFDDVIAVGNGFIAKGGIEGWIMDRLWDLSGRPHFKKFRIRLKLEVVEEVSCENCPYLNDYCGSNYGCQSKDVVELAKRRGAIKEGQAKIL